MVWKQSADLEQVVLAWVETSKTSYDIKPIQSLEKVCLWPKYTDSPYNSKVYFIKPLEIFKLGQDNGPTKPQG